MLHCRTHLEWQDVTRLVAAKLATGAVTTDAMAADSIATASVIDNAITTAKILDQCRSEE